MVRKQLKQEYDQKSTSTTLPRNASAVSGFEFSHSTAPSSEGNVPSTGSASALSLGAAAFIIDGLGCIAPLTAGDIAPLSGARNLSISACSTAEVCASETLARKLVSKPNAMATTAASTN